MNMQLFKSRRFLQIRLHRMAAPNESLMLPDAETTRTTVQKKVLLKTLRAK
jgi:hypothetical protein